MLFDCAQTAALTSEHDRLYNRLTGAQGRPPAQEALTLLSHLFHFD